MKIIFVTREGYHLSGARVRCYNFARQLGIRGIDTEVFSFGDHLGARYGEKEFEMSLSWKLNLIVKAIKELSRKNKDAVFFVQRLNYHALAPFVVSLLGRHKIIFDCDDWNIRENPVYHFGFYPSSKMEFFTRKLARYSSCCIAASCFLKEYLSSYNRKTYYVPTGVDTEVFKPFQRLRQRNEVVLSWIGTIYHQEMFESVRFVIDCFVALACDYQGLFLHLAGTGVYFKEIREYVSTLACKDRIRISGWIHPDQIPGYLAQTDIGLLPLIHDTKFNKAKSPTKLFEYMAMAKPTVSSRIGEAARIIKDGDSGLLAGDKDEFIEKLKILIDNPVLAETVGNNARGLVEKSYSLSVLGEQVYDIAASLA
jgi:glycosyltransferase involved in cell wall biosynthesis